MWSKCRVWNNKHNSYHLLCYCFQAVAVPSSLQAFSHPSSDGGAVITPSYSQRVKSIPHSTWSQLGNGSHWTQGFFLKNNFKLLHFCISALIFVLVVK